MAKEYTRAITTLGSLPVAAAILYHQPFEHLVGLAGVVAGAGSTVELDPSLAFTGANSLYTSTRTTGAAEDDSAELSDIFQNPPSGQVLFSMRFRFPDFSKLKTLTTKVEFLDGTNRHMATFIYNTADDTFSYVDEGGSPVTLVTFPRILTNDMWSILNISVDFSANQFVAVQLNDTIYDLSGVPLEDAAVAAGPRSQYIITALTAGAAAVAFSLDEVAIIDGRLQ